MAGESPDRSKQRESSAEPTSGSASPVPEARGEVRDPRLAVARDSEPPAARGGVDTATRVFSARDVAKARAAAQEPKPTDPDEASGTPDEAATATEGPQSPGKADKQPPAAEDVQDAVPTDGAEGSRDAEASAGPVEPASAGTEGAEEAADARAGVSEGAGAAAVADDGPAKGAEGAEAAAAVEDVQDAVPTDGAEGSRDVKASAATVESASAGAERAAGAADARAGASEGAGDAAAAGDVQDVVPTDDGPAKGAVPTDGAEGSRDAEDSARPDETAPVAPEGEPGGGDARLRAAVAAWVRSGDSPNAADPGGEAGERPASAAKADAAATDPRATVNPSDGVDAREKSARRTGEAGEKADAAATDPRATANPGDAVDAREKSARTAREAGEKADVAATDPRATANPGDAVGAREKSARTAREAGEKADRPVPGAGGNDAKAEGDAGPRVDQPTTMLKLPSKFVALKPDVTTPVPQVGPERTTQQPLPPKPPLDLLAELTNTPPPPQTPLRTTFRRVKIWTPLVLLLAVVFAVAQAMRPLPTPTLELTAEDSYSFDGSKVDIPWPAEGQAALDVQGIGSFGSSGDRKPVPIASVAKVMTAYVILRDHPLKSGAEGPKIKIDQTAQEQGENAGQESTVKVTAGDSISQREALESILIASANNVARLLARWDAGSEKAFVEKMNAAAEDLGMTNTTYTDPSGLNNTTVSTAVDQVKLGKKAMEEPAFREVAAMMSYDDYKGVNHGNWNQIVGKNNVVGIKTGTTTSALGNLLFAAKKEVDGETRTIVGAVIRQPAGGVDNTILSAALTAGDRLIRAAQGALESATILKKGDVVGYVDDGLGGRTPVIATKDVTAVGWSGLTVKLTFAADDVPHTAKAGTKVGTLTVGDASAGAVKVPVALQKDLVEPGFTDKLTRIS
ncbi:D-alanyl-D-alanine carboxypeptidase [Streptomyces sp. WM6386]|uniref:D-alanyl-D-alanine carboxypeptidase n=1 Tax=Streptomyces sp. WM6386 TaxID=1415558 RepID=UPI0006194431|nr:D-alanyl-D-alanine carboxypeptidase [Streptomyces sp. WM6386]KKD04086.1 D-alanyl-D-alanine carboxypeptidase [Streptomyces sp. WM6386]